MQFNPVCASPEVTRLDVTEDGSEMLALALVIQCFKVVCRLTTKKLVYLARLCAGGVLFESDFRVASERFMEREARMCTSSVVRLGYEASVGIL